VNCMLFLPAVVSVLAGEQPDHVHRPSQLVINVKLRISPLATKNRAGLGVAENIGGFMCVAIPSLFPELSTLASKIESPLKDSMNYFVELASAPVFPEKQSQSSREHNFELMGSRVVGTSSGTSRRIYEASTK